jgi:hypothetical protein
MAKNVSLALILIACQTGCLVDMLATTAIEGELHKKSLESSMKALDYAKQTTGQIGAQQAIEAYRAEHGTNPPSLEALVPGYLATMPVQSDGRPWSYDPATGTLSDMPGANPAATAGLQDRIAMEQIQAAINKYGTATGYYPPSLQTLVPTYLSSVPKASNGQDFIFYPQDGRLINPAETQVATGAFPPPASTSQRPSRGRGVAGAGPMGEVMTGISMSNELDNMSSAGSNAAGSRARQGARDIGQGQNQRIDNTLKSLGY